MFNQRDVNHLFVPIRTKNPTPPTRKDILDFWIDQEIVFCLEYYEGISNQDMEQVGKIYSQLLFYLIINFRDWKRKDVQQLCCTLNIYFKDYAAIAIATPNSYETVRQWNRATTHFRKTFNDVTRECVWMN